MKYLRLFLLVLLLQVPFLKVSAIEPIIGYEIKMSYALKNKSEAPYELTMDDKSIILSLNTTWQSFFLKDCNYPIQNKTFDKDNNSIAILDLDDVLEPNQSITINLTYHAYLFERPKLKLSIEESGNLEEIPNELKEKYTQPLGPWKYDEWENIKNFATQLQNGSNNVLKILYSFIGWIGENIKYKTNIGPKYPNETYKELKGDCDDQANLLIALCRAVGIPAYLQIGAVFLPGKGRSPPTEFNHIIIWEERIGFHGWAMVYIPPWEWIPVDLTFGFDKENPETAILYSAISFMITVATSNIAYTDYIEDFKESLKHIKEKELFLEEVYSMNIILLKITYSLPTIIIALACLIVISTGSFVTYFLIRRESSKKV